MITNMPSCQEWLHGTWPCGDFTWFLSEHWLCSQNIPNTRKEASLADGWPRINDNVSCDSRSPKMPGSNWNSRVMGRKLSSSNGGDVLTVEDPGARNMTFDVYGTHQGSNPGTFGKKGVWAAPGALVSTGVHNRSWTSDFVLLGQHHILRGDGNHHNVQSWCSATGRHPHKMTDSVPVLHLLKLRFPTHPLTFASPNLSW